MLIWPKTGVEGLRLDRDGGAWVHTPVPESSAFRCPAPPTWVFPNRGLEGKLSDWLVIRKMNLLRRGKMDTWANNLQVALNSAA
jgi:hypothetical protein